MQNTHKFKVKTVPAKQPGRALGFRYRLLLYFAAVIFLPLVTLGIAAPIFYARAVERMSAEHSNQMIEQLTRSVQLYIEDIEKTLDFIIARPEIIHFLKGGKGDETNKLLSNIKASRPEFAGFLLLSADDRLYSTDFIRISRDALTEEAWYVAAVKSERKLALLPRPVGRNVRIRSGTSADEIVTIAKAVHGDTSILGVIALDLDLRVVRGLLTEGKIGAMGFLFIADKNGEPILAPSNPIVYRILPDWVVTKPGLPKPWLASPSGIIRRIQNVDYQIFSRPSSYTGWITVGVISRTKTLPETAYLRYSAIVIGGITVIIALLLSFFLASAIARPVIELETLMGRAEDGDLSARFIGSTRDEVGRLGEKYNVMIAKIGTLIDLVYKEQKDKREAELHILQEQIKPHFLYNTLETIRYMAKRRGAHDVVEIISALTKLFRIGLSKGKETISLKEELEHVSSYLFIQSQRYSGKFDYSIHVDNDCLDNKVQRMILQPLAENAIYHGVREKHEKGMIRIEAIKTNTCLQIIISDNGAGMDERRLAEVKKIIDSRQPIPDSESGYGIYNVHERVRSYGQEFGLFYESVAGKSTRVTIYHPILESDNE